MGSEHKRDRNEPRDACARSLPLRGARGTPLARTARQGKLVPTNQSLELAKRGLLSVKQRRPLLRSPSILPLRHHRVRLLRIDPQILDRVLHRGFSHQSLLSQLVQRRNRDEPRVHFKKVTQRFTPFASSKAIRAQSRHPPWHPLRYHRRQHLDRKST